MPQVRLKPKVKKLQCEAKLDTGGRNYNTNVENSRQVGPCCMPSPRKTEA